MLRNSVIKTLLFVLILSACKTTYILDRKEATHQEIKYNEADRKFDSLIKPYKLSLSQKMDQSLVLCSDNLTKDGDEMTIGNFMCDAIKWAYDSINKQNTKALVLMNRGGIRTNLNKGMITVSSIYELMPFENEIELVEIKGSELKSIIKSIIEKKHAFLGLKIQVSKDSVVNSTIDGKSIENEQIYQLITSDFLVSGGDNFTFGQGKISSVKPDLKIRDALILYCLHLNCTNKTIIPYTDGRLEISR